MNNLWLKNETFFSMRRCNKCGIFYSCPIGYEAHLHKFTTVCICKETFLNECEYQLHFQDKYKPKMYQCCVCEISFKHKYEFKHHIIDHGAFKEGYTCQYCEKSFHYFDQLAHHDFENGTQDSSQCEMCGECFSRKCALQTHENTHRSDQVLFSDENVNPNAVLTASSKNAITFSDKSSKSVFQPTINCQTYLEDDQVHHSNPEVSDIEHQTLSHHLIQIAENFLAQNSKGNSAQFFGEKKADKNTEQNSLQQLEELFKFDVILGSTVTVEPFPPDTVTVEPSPPHTVAVEPPPPDTVTVEPFQENSTVKPSKENESKKVVNIIVENFVQKIPCCTEFCKNHIWKSSNRNLKKNTVQDLNQIINISVQDSFQLFPENNPSQNSKRSPLEPITQNLPARSKQNQTKDLEKDRAGCLKENAVSHTNQSQYHISFKNQSCTTQDRSHHSSRILPPDETQSRIHQAPRSQIQCFPKTEVHFPRTETEQMDINVSNDSKENVHHELKPNNGGHPLQQNLVHTSQKSQFHYGEPMQVSQQILDYPWQQNARWPLQHFEQCQRNRIPLQQNHVDIQQQNPIHPLQQNIDHSQQNSLYIFQQNLDNLSKLNKAHSLQRNLDKSCQQDPVHSSQKNPTHSSQQNLGYHWQQNPDHVLHQNLGHILHENPTLTMPKSFAHLQQQVQPSLLQQFQVPPPRQIPVPPPRQIPVPPPCQIPVSLQQQTQTQRLPTVSAQPHSMSSASGIQSPSMPLLRPQKYPPNIRFYNRPSKY